MDIERYVCTFEQAKELKELGVNLSPKYFWCTTGLHNKPMVYNIENIRTLGNNMVYQDDDHETWTIDQLYAAYDTTELSRMLPFIIGPRFNVDHDYFLDIHGGNKGWHVQYKTSRGEVVINSEGEIDREVKYLLKTYRVDYDLPKALAQYVILLLTSKTLTKELINDRYI